MPRELICISLSWAHEIVAGMPEPRVLDVKFGPARVETTGEPPTDDISTDMDAGDILPE
jgi:hypothetical protein